MTWPRTRRPGQPLTEWAATRAAMWLNWWAAESALRRGDPHEGSHLLAAIQHSNSDHQPVACPLPDLDDITAAYAKAWRATDVEH